MVSAIILLAVWALLLNCFNTNNKEANWANSNLLWSILFGCSLATVSAIYLLQINILPSLLANQWALGLEISVSLAYLAYALSKKSLAKKLVSPFSGEFKLTRLSTLAGITLLFIFTTFTSAPLNWDSNAYNVARISTFLNSSSSILDTTTASARQAIYSVGHDILLYPDVSFGILRGLSMVSLLEFIVLLGTLLVLSNTIGNIVFANQHRAPKVAGLVVIILAFNSNQQVMQALVTKNDLAITLLFTISIATGIAYLYKQQKCFSEGITMSAIVLMLCMAINMKSYGIILIIPAGLTAFTIIIRRLLAGKPKDLVAPSNIANSLYNLLIILSISTLITFSIQTSLVHRAWLNAPGRVTSITSAWTNQKGSWNTRLENSLVNSGRILLQGSLFPYTALKPYLPIGPELKSPINDTIIPKALQGSKGSGSGTFSLLYGTNPDMAYPLLGFQIGLILGLLGWCSSRQLKGLTGALFILISSGLTLLFFGTALLYQPWISRFMGPTYIPLIPIAAIGICFLLQRLPYSSLQENKLGRRISQTTAFLLGILPLISSMSLTGYLSRRSGMPQGKSDFYNQYLWSQKGLSKQKSNQFIKQLKSNVFDFRYLCSSDGPWTLTPMILSQSNQSFENNNIKLLNRNECQQKADELRGSSTNLDPGQSIQINGTEFISLP